MKYKIAEKFKSLQGEGVYAGTPMAFIRFVGCSVGKRICQHCDTDFDNSMPWRGGGEFSAEELCNWVGDYEHICFTGGEPLNQNLRPIMEQWNGGMAPMFHIETSGTVHFEMPDIHNLRTWVCVSPKPGYLPGCIDKADEIKIIVPGLGEINDKVQFVETGARDPKSGYAIVQHTPTNFRWPDIYDALRWHEQYPDKPIFLQPRNAKFTLDKNNLVIVQDLLREYPQFRLSLQLHKLLGVQ